MSLPSSTYTNIMDDPNVDPLQYLVSLLEEVTDDCGEEELTQEQLRQKYISTTYIVYKMKIIR